MPLGKLIHRLMRHVSKWGTIEVLFLGCYGATWKYFENTEFAPYIIVGGFSLCALLGLYQVSQKRQKWWIKYGVPLLAIPLFILLCWFVSVFTTREWQPPKLGPDVTKVAVKFGSETYQFSLKRLWMTPDRAISKVRGKYVGFADIQMNLGNQTFKHPMRPEIKRNRFYVSVTVPYQKERRRISMDDALDRDLPPNWDRNFTTNAFEIVREDFTPVLQVIYRRPDVIEVYGVFELDKNHVFVAFGPTNSIWLQNLTADNTTVTADSSYEILSITAFQTDFVRRKPLFKYPSYKYSGMFAE